MNHFTILDNSWKPSTFYDGKKELIWINNYELFKEIYKNKRENNYLYAIHKDVYDAFLYKYKNYKKHIIKKSKFSNRKTIKKSKNKKTNREKKKTYKRKRNIQNK